MTLGVNPTRDAILDGMVSALGAITASPGNARSPTRPLYTSQRYASQDFPTDRGLADGVAGRTPAARVAFLGERTVRTTIGRRRDLVEGVFGVFTVSDDRSDRDARAVLYAVSEKIRSIVAGRALALGIRPLRWTACDVARDDDKLLALIDRFVTRYRVDHTKQAAYDALESIGGDIHSMGNIPDGTALPARPVAPTVVQVGGAAGTTQHAYVVEAVFGAGPFSNPSDRGVLATGAAALGSGVSMSVSWPAVTGATGYRVWRVESPASLGYIATTASTTFVDDGSIVADGKLPPTRGVRMELAFP